MDGSVKHWNAFELLMVQVHRPATCSAPGQKRGVCTYIERQRETERERVQGLRVYIMKGLGVHMGPLVEEFRVEECFTRL